MKYRARFPCRCSSRKCRQRVTLSMRPEHYIRAPKCGGCGGRAFAIDRFRKAGEHRRYACDCSGYGFRHRKGSKWCTHARVEPDADEIAARYGSEYREAAGEGCPF